MPDIFVTKEEREKKHPHLKHSFHAFLRSPLMASHYKALEHQSAIPLAALIFRPKNLRFETQEKEEKIALLVRRHPVTNLPWMAILFLILILPSIVSRVFSLAFIPANYRLMVSICWYLFSFAFAFERFLTWFFNVDLITDERVVDIDFPTLLYRNIKETKIDKIQDINLKTGGYVRSLFDFGDVLIQTAGAIPEICFEAVPKPEIISQILNDLMLEEEQEKLNRRAK